MHFSDNAQAEKMLSDCSASAGLWTQVVKGVFAKEEWRSIFLLFNSGLTRHCNFVSIEYTEVTKLNSKLWRKYAESIVIHLLEHGASQKPLEPQTKGCTALHGVVKMSLVKGGFRLAAMSIQFQGPFMGCLAVSFTVLYLLNAHFLSD